MAKKKNAEHVNLAKIKVVGVGGAGGNAVSRMFEDFPRGVDLIAINTDIQDLNYTKAKKKIHIGKNITRGLGTGMNPELGRQAAEENRGEIAEAIKGADMVFITAGMSGGTGSGAAPIVAEIARELGILTVSIVTKPFGFEGAQRVKVAQEAIAKLKDRVDALIIIPNDRIFSLIDKNTSLLKAFEEIDEVLKNAVQGITELVTTPGIVNVDFADVKAVMQESGSAIIGIGKATGTDRALNAATFAINSPLLEISVDGAKGVLFSVSGRRDLKMSEVNEIANLIAENVDQSAKIIFGTYHDRRLRKGQIKVTLVATGFNGSLSKSNIISPSLFPGFPFEAINNDGKEENYNFIDKKEDDEIKQNRFQLDLTKKSSDKIKKEKAKEEVEDETWEIPAFLRKKKKK